jgi:hypothetical protein
MKLAALLVLIASPAAASPSDREEVMIGDGASDALMLTVFSDTLDHGSGGTLFFLGAAGYTLAPPIIHAANHEWGRAGIDLGVRVGLPVVGLALGNAICSQEDHHAGDLQPCLGSALIGGALGMIGAEVIDWTAIARGPSAPAMPIAHVISIGGSFW